MAQQFQGKRTARIRVLYLVGKFGDGDGFNRVSDCCTDRNPVGPICPRYFWRASILKRTVDTFAVSRINEVQGLAPQTRRVDRFLRIDI